MTTSALMDAVLLVLLVLGCGYCTVLSRRLKRLRDGQTELFAAIERFDASCRRAEDVLARIDAAGAGSLSALADRTAKADRLANDLEIMTASGDRIASRIEALLGELRLAGRSGRSRSAA